METSDFLLSNMRLTSNAIPPPGRAGLFGWEKDTKRLFPTLARQSEEEAWGFSLSAGADLGGDSAHWSGVAAK